MDTMCCFFFNDTATTEIYTLSLHDALPICPARRGHPVPARRVARDLGARRPGDAPRPRPDGEAGGRAAGARRARGAGRSEEHTSELQSRQYLVCRLLLEKKKNTIHRIRLRA